MKWLQIALSVSTVLFCLGADLDTVLRKLYAMEQSLHQDIRIMRETVESNRQAIANVLNIVNNSKLAMDPSGDVETVAVKSNMEEKEFASLKEDIERVKRAFGEEKNHLRETESNLRVDVDKFGDYMAQHMSSITKEMNYTRNNVTEAVGNLENELSEQLKDLASSAISNVSVLVSAGIESINHEIYNVTEAVGKLENKLSEQLKGIENNSIDLAERVHANSGNLENQINLLTNISRLAKETSSATDDVSASVLLILNSHKNVRLGNIATDGSAVQGRVEVLYNVHWGTVCDDNFNNTDATVVCRSLGYSVGEAKAGAYFGQGSGEILLDEVQCRGTENNIFSCPASPIGTHNCDHNEDVGVICR